MSLTDREKEQLKEMIEAGAPLPQKYRAVLFADPHDAELIWPGKTSEMTSVVLPFQPIEQIDGSWLEMNAPVSGHAGMRGRTQQGSRAATSPERGGMSNLVMPTGVNS